MRCASSSASNAAGRISSLQAAHASHLALATVNGPPGMFGGGSDENRPNPIAMLATALLAPFAATVIQMAISRTREYDADEDGSRLTGDPLALASALRKLETGVARAPLAPSQQLVNASHMMIANPFRAQDVSRLFSTHPPMHERIARLEGMARGPQGMASGR